MTTIDSSNSKNRIKQALFAFASSFLFLLFLFVTTMLKHQNGQIDWSYLLYAITRIGFLSICPVVIVIFAKVSKWYWSVPCGVVVGVLAAALFVNLK